MATFGRLFLLNSRSSRTLVATATAVVPLVAFGISQTSLEEPPETKKHTRILVVGGGSAGIGVAAQLQKAGEKDVTILEPNPMHYYQPLWTLVGGGVKKSKTESCQPMSEVIPRGVQHVKDAASRFDPEHNKLITQSGKEVTYDYLVVATGMTTDFGTVPGLKETIGKNGVVSIYDYDLCQNTQEVIQSTTKGNWIFTQHADSPIKCGGAPQKIMWLAEDHATRHGFRQNITVHWIAPQPTMFAVPKYSNILRDLADKRGVERHHGWKLVKVDGPKQQATFQNVSDPSQTKVMDFAILHVVPYMAPPKAIVESKLADASGFVQVDPSTLQHATYPNVFALGDAANLPTSKTMAAIAAQVPVVVHNLQAQENQQSLTAKYDGYTSCPITTAKNRLLLAEFKYNGELAETFPWLQGQPRLVFMFLKETVFPWAYFKLFLPGNWYGPRTIFPPRFPPGSENNSSAPAAEKK